MKSHIWGQSWLLAYHVGILDLELSWADQLGQRLHPWIENTEQNIEMWGRFIWSLCRQSSCFEDLTLLSFQEENIIPVLETVLLQRKSTGLGDRSSHVDASSFGFNDLGQIISLSDLLIYKVRYSPCLNYLTGLLGIK